MFSLYVACVSGASLLLFAGLFHFEERRQARLVLTRFREWLDRKAERAVVRFDRVRDYIGTGSFRVMFHYMLHAVISCLVRVSEYIGTSLKRLERRNRKMARHIRDTSTKSHLDLIAEHKVTTALSERERHVLKQRSLEGDI